MASKKIKPTAVFDTNVLISAAFGKKGTTPDQLLQALRNQAFILVSSPEILTEIEDVLHREKVLKITKMTSPEIKRFMQDIIELAFVVSGDTAVNIIARDPDDNKFLGAALEAKAEYIISGDHHLLELKKYHGIKILTPNKFLTILKQNNP